MMARKPKYGYTRCGLCGLPVTVRPATATLARREGYDADYDGEYLIARCGVCAGYKTLVYHEDVDTRGTE